MKIKFKLSKQTKRAVQYKEVSAEEGKEICQTIYFKKWWLGSPIPQEIEIEVQRPNVP